MKRLLFVFFLFSPLFVSAQTDSLRTDSLYKDANRAASRARYSAEQGMYEIEKGRSAISKYQRLVDSKYKKAALLNIAELYNDMGMADSVFGATGTSIYFDSAKVYYSKVLETGFKHTELLYKLALTQLLLKEYEPAKENLELAFQQDTSRKFKKKVITQMGGTAYLLAIIADRMKEPSKKQALFQHCVNYTVVAYEFEVNREVEDMIYDYSKLAGDTVTQEKFRKILIEKYGTTRDEGE
jgi:tetratricopeptide (TPR) repeat protein